MVAKRSHYLLQVRTTVLNEELADKFEQWYPGVKINNNVNMNTTNYRKAA